jgi:hypothetical protein
VNLKSSVPEKGLLSNQDMPANDIKKRWGGGGNFIYEGDGKQSHL